MSQGKFTGSKIGTPDEKDRIGLMTRHVDDLTRKVHLCAGLSHYIELRDGPEWERYKKRIETKAAKGTRKHRQLARHVLGDHREVRVDAQNRIRLGSDLMEWAGIPAHDEPGSREVKIVGVSTHIEIWLKSTYQAQTAAIEDDFEDIYDEPIPGDTTDEAPESDGT